MDALKIFTTKVRIRKYASVVFQYSVGMKRMNALKTAILAASFIGIFSSANAADPLPQFGYLEKVKVGPDALPMRAKLDTGADTSSLGYQQMERFRKDGADWVMVTVSNADGNSFSTVRKILRVASIKRKNGPSVERPVILINICLGGIRKLTEVTIANRTTFSVPVLIGRSFLAGAAVVDSAREYTTEPSCDTGNKQ
jgi:hypothetical protein